MFIVVEGPSKSKLARNPSALAKNGQFVLSKSDPLKEQDLAQCKHTKSSIIRAEGA
jgi:hypothetical protein